MEIVKKIEKITDEILCKMMELDALSVPSVLMITMPDGTFVKIYGYSAPHQLAGSSTVSSVQHQASCQ